MQSVLLDKHAAAVKKRHTDLHRVEQKGIAAVGMIRTRVSDQ